MSEVETEPADQIVSTQDGIMALIFVVLFGGRWAFGTLATWIGLIRQEQLTALDERYFLPFYLILVVISVILLTLRALRKHAASPTGG